MLIKELEQLAVGVSAKVFREQLLGALTVTNAQSWSNVSSWDYFSENLRFDADKAMSDRNTWRRSAEKIYGRVTPEELRTGLISLLSRTDLKYADRNFGGINRKFKDRPEAEKEKYIQDSLIAYSPEMLGTLRAGLEGRKDFKLSELCDIIWGICYLAIHKELPKELDTEDRIRRDEEQYYTRVMRDYGKTATPAYRVTLGLANDGNVVAQNEVGELLYYGRFSDRRKQYDRAYIWFKKAAGDTDITKGIHYPRACWNMAYMIFNYHRKNELEEVYIDDLEEIPEDQRVELAMDYLTMALIIDPECIPGYNLMGVFLDTYDKPGDPTFMWMQKRISGDRALMAILQQKLEELDCGVTTKRICPEIFFDIAASRNYVEACNNLARREAKKALGAKAGSREQSDYIDKMVEYLSRASENYGTYAANKLGEFYRDGTVRVSYPRDPNVKESSRTKDEEHFPSRIDDVKAIKYYKKAIEFFEDVHSAWAAYNLLAYYENRISRDTIKRCEDILEITDNANVRARYEVFCRERKKGPT